jgi:putative N6-adenine-specific DNA methylase
MKFNYQKYGQYFAQVAGGMESMGEIELKKLGAVNISKAYRGLHFEANHETLYKVNYCSRLCTRFLAPLVHFRVHNTDYLYKKAKEIPWEMFLDPAKTFAVFSTVSHSHIRHSQYASLKIKDAVVDSIRDKTGVRPDIDRLTPDLWINLHIQNNKASISVDTSGGSLHRRGYRQNQLHAPMQETVAAAIIKMSHWNGETLFYDPFCGSGTLVCEALMHAARIPAGYLRKSFGFERLPDFNAKKWQEIKKIENEQIKPIPRGLINASDINAEAVEIARMNCQNLPFGDSISLRQADFKELGTLRGITLITNPPFGVRMSNEKELLKLYKQFGDFLKQFCPQSTAYIYIGKRKWISHIGLRPKWKKPLKSGDLDGRLISIPIYD